MRNFISTMLLLTVWTFTYGQEDNINQYNKADSLYQADNYNDALPLYRELE
jgi:hypothetical protein